MRSLYEGKKNTLLSGKQVLQTFIQGPFHFVGEKRKQGTLGLIDGQVTTVPQRACTEQEFCLGTSQKLQKLFKI